jgi:hypothetical protein
MSSTMNQVSDPKTEQAITADMEDIIFTVNDLLGKRRMFPALILLYAGIDIFGSWLRPKSRLENNSKDFRDWADRYLLKGSSLPLTADDLWGARCGLLHAATAGSKNSRAGQAREIHYIRAGEDCATFVQQQMQQAGHNKVVVDVDAFFNAFCEGVGRFIQDIGKDSQIQDLVFFHAKHILWQQTMGPARSSPPS